MLKIQLAVRKADLVNVSNHSGDPRLSQEHRTLQEKRTVVLLHIIAYFR